MPTLTDHADVVFIDFAMMSALLVVGQALRAKIRLMQIWRIPACIIAGGLALSFGPNQWAYFPISEAIDKYPKILVVLIFAAIPIGMKSVDFGHVKRNAGEMFSHVCFGILAQYGWGLLLGLTVLGAVWDLYSGFGIVLGIGFWGGPGTTTAAASAFESSGQSDDILSLGLTAWMVGTLISIILGTIMVNLYARKARLSGEDMPEESNDYAHPSGFIPEKHRKALGMETVSSASIESLTLHLAIIMSVAMAGWYGSELLKSWWPSVNFPAFGMALILGFFFQKGLSLSRADSHVDPMTIHRINGLFTDYLIVSGIASIKIESVIPYAVPLSILLSFGVLLSLFQVYVLGPWMFKEHWFEKSILIFGINTGTLAQGIMLLRMIDPQMKSKALETYSVVDLLIKPLTMGLVVVGPMMIISGYVVHLAVVCSALAFLPLIVTAVLRRKQAKASR